MTGAVVARHKRTGIKLLVAAALCGSIMTASRPAEAQFTIGFAGGAGLTSASNFDLGPVGWFNFRVGGMLNRNLALLFDAEMFFTYLGRDGFADVYATTAVLSPALQVFFLPSPVWMKFGAGLAVSDILSNNAGFGATVGLGIDLIRRGRYRYKRFALSLETQVAPMFFDSGHIVAWTVGIGVQWF